MRVPQNLVRVSETGAAQDCRCVREPLVLMVQLDVRCCVSAVAAVVRCLCDGGERGDCTGMTECAVREQSVTLCSRAYSYFQVHVQWYNGIVQV